jgi:SAM-dependent methyltransferase
LDDAFDGEGGIGGVRKLVQLDSSEELLERDKDVPIEGSHRCESFRLHADEEDKLPFPDGTFDLVMSSQSLHWVNDLPGLFKEVMVGRAFSFCFKTRTSQTHQTRIPIDSVF